MGGVYVKWEEVCEIEGVISLEAAREMGGVSEIRGVISLDSEVGGVCEIRVISLEADCKMRGVSEVGGVCEEEGSTGWSIKSFLLHVLCSLLATDWQRARGGPDEGGLEGGWSGGGVERGREGAGGGERGREGAGGGERGREGRVRVKLKAAGGGTEDELNVTLLRVKQLHIEQLICTGVSY